MSERIGSWDNLFRSSKVLGSIVRYDNICSLPYLYDFPITKLTDASQFFDYKADIEQPLPMIYQSGYLTIKDCNIDRNTYLLDIPNEEVRNGFIEIIKQIDDKGYTKPYAADNRKVIALGINFSSEKGTIDGFMTKEL